MILPPPRRRRIILATVQAGWGFENTYEATGGLQEKKEKGPYAYSYTVNGICTYSTYIYIYNTVS